MTRAQDKAIPNERWLPVVGYEGIYDVSDRGRVRRAKSGKSTLVGRMMEGSVDTRDYIRVGLYKDSRQRTHRLHRLVAAAFIGPCPDGKEVNHKDGIKPNNGVSNLEYVTKSENTLHAFRNGLKVAVHGEAIGSAKLTEENIHVIWRRLLAKESQRSIAKRLHVCRATISAIATGRTWAWLKEA